MSILPAGILALALLFIVACPAAAGPRERTVFLTSATFDGNLGGLAGADAKCQAEADGPGTTVPAGTYRAWLSDGTGSPSTRFAKSFDPFVLPDGTPIADDFLDLVHGHILNPIDLDVTGTRVGRVLFWTGTKTDGTSVSAFVTCEGWTASGGAGGVAGSTVETGPAWSQFRGGLPCNRKARLACFQQ